MSSMKVENVLLKLVIDIITLSNLMNFINNLLDNIERNAPNYKNQPTLMKSNFVGTGIK